MLGFPLFSQLETVHTNKPSFSMWNISVCTQDIFWRWNAETKKSISQDASIIVVVPSTIRLTQDKHLRLVYKSLQIRKWSTVPQILETFKILSTDSKVRTTMYGTKQYHWKPKVLLSSFHLNGHTLGFQYGGS